ncbi:MAG TPA: hypothetical protein VGN63_03910 [Flavisolibacter sp.]|jgi:hypothetical protein|nr:hypothetical protein [Flavisolibacter sp.]
MIKKGFPAFFQMEQKIIGLLAALEQLNGKAIFVGGEGVADKTQIIFIIIGINKEVPGWCGFVHDSGVAAAKIQFLP